MGEATLLSAAEREAARDLFEQAIEHEPASAAWVEQADASTRVKAEVLSLLAHHRLAGAFLAAPVADRISDLFSDVSPLEPGATVGPYAIIRELGQGGMGCVYLATDTRLDRPVALKAITPRLTGSAVERERLRQEARAAAQLSHPGICTVYALEDVDGELFIASEFIDGHTLREEIAGRDRPSAHMVAQAARELAAALAAAHERGVTHRDLKPENVMRGRDGRLKILDFGLATVSVSALADRATTEKPPDTFSIHGEWLAGTPAYMTPEQLNGARTDLRSDLFQLGMVLHEYAAGTHPFVAPTFVARTARVLEGSPDPLDGLRPDLPPGVLHVVERCLRKSPMERFQSAGDLLGVLAADTPPAGPRSAVWWRTHQLVIIALYVAACVLGWQIKEWRHGVPTVAFLALGVLATVGGVFRGHLAFTERFNRTSFDAERRRAAPILLTTDLLIAFLLGIDGGLIAITQPLFAVITFALGLGVALARVVLEPVTTVSTFRETEPYARD